MSYLTNHAERTLSRADRVADMWTNTLYETEINSYVDRVHIALEKEDAEDFASSIVRLSDLLDNAERQYDSEY